MIFDMVTMAFLDGGIAAVFNSPFIIPVAGCVMVACIVVSSVWAGVRSQEIKSQERLARIANGLPVDANWDEATVKAAMEPPAEPGVHGAAARGGKVNDGSGARRAGIVLVSIGAGLFLFFAMLATILRVREVLSGAVAGVLPLAIGIGFLVDARIKKAEYERRLAAGWYATPGLGVGAPQAGAPAPPPPPVGMSAAQASDWRPLH